MRTILTVVILAALAWASPKAQNQPNVPGGATAKIGRCSVDRYLAPRLKRDDDLNWQANRGTGARSAPGWVPDL